MKQYLIRVHVFDILLPGTSRAETNREVREREREKIAREKAGQPRMNSGT